MMPSMRTRALQYVALGCVLIACHHRTASTVPVSSGCPAPDAAGMSARLAQRFYRMRDDTLQRALLIRDGISVNALTEPVLVNDSALCGRIAAAIGMRSAAGAGASMAEGVAYYRSGPYFLYAPWRDYDRRAEWRNRSEFVGLVVLGPDLKVVTAIGM